MNYKDLTINTVCTQRFSQQHKICLIHGLACGPWIMGYLAHFFKKRGFTTCSLKYSSMRRTFEDNVVITRRLIEKIPADTIDIVAHSLGGLLTLAMLQAYPDSRIKRIVLLGSPIQGSRCGEFIASHRLGRMLLGHNASLWHDMPSLVLPAQSEVGAIAGDYAPKFSSGTLAKLEPPHDGIVMTQETYVPGLSDFIILPVSHTGLLFSGCVANKAIHFLKLGKFG